MSTAEMRASRRSHAWLLLAALGALAFLGLADLAQDQHFPAADVTTRAFVQGEREPALERPMRLVTRLGSGLVLVPLNALVLGALWGRDRRLAVLVPVTTAGATLLEGVTKWVVARPRPNLHAYGFPSGHSMASVVFFGALAYLLWTSGRGGRAARWAGAVGCALVVLAIAYSRLYLDAHWLTDVIGGLIGGGAYLVFSLAAFERFWRHAPGTPIGAATDAVEPEPPLGSRE